MKERSIRVIPEASRTRRLALLAAGALLATTGCSSGGDSTTETKHSPSPAVEKITQTPQITREQLIQNPELLAKTRDTLPPKVQKAASATVRLLNYTGAKTEFVGPDGDVQYSSPGTYTSGSGSVVKVGGQNMILTAGHVVKETNEHCGTEEIHYQSKNNAIHGGVGSQYAEFSSVLYLGQKPDTAMLAPHATAEWQNNGQSEFAAPLRQDVFAVTGDEVFITGYPDPIKGEEQRDPANLGHEGHPNLHNALILGESNGYLVMLDGSGKSFAPGSTSSQTRPGNSGGPVIDQEGYQIGVISGSSSLPSSTKGIAESFGVHIDNPEDYSLAFAQIVDQPSAQKLANQALSAQPCTDLPVSRVPAQ